MIDENYTEITQDKINEVKRTLNSGFCDYKLKDSQFNIETLKRVKTLR